MKFLVVDDSKTMRMIVKRTLRQAGFGDCEILEASNGVEALETMKQGSIDLVLCDWNMPEMNGLDLLKSLRGAGNDVKFGFVTSESTPEMQGVARENGALFLISKPFTEETFKDTIGAVLK